MNGASGTFTASTPAAVKFYNMPGDPGQSVLLLITSGNPDRTIPIRTMETKQATYVTLACTDRVSLNDWRGKTRLQINETSDRTLEVSEIETDEMLRAISYFVRNLATSSDRSETQGRILADMLASLTAALKTEETAV